MQYEQIVVGLAAWSYFAVFFLVMLENAGLPLPSLTVALIMAALAGQGSLNFWMVYGLTIGGGTVGGLLGYWVGLKGGRRVLEKYGRYFRLTPRRFTQAEGVFHRHGSKAVWLRCYLPLICVWGCNLAGIARIPSRRFLVANIGGMALYSTTNLTLAFVLGRSFETVTRMMNGMLFVVAALAVMVIVFFTLRKRTQARQALPVYNRDLPEIEELSK